jgi:putative two-component system response regulator
MASDICRHHHERFDGKGYPDGLAGSTIPLAARIVAVADVYDALRSYRVYKPSLGHPVALQMMMRSSGQFDPSLLRVFERCHQQFERIFSELMN